MKVLLFILAVGLGLATLAARRNLSRSLQTDEDDSPKFAESIRTSQTAVQNLNDAISRISKSGNIPAQQLAAPAQVANPLEQITAQVDKLLGIMQSDPDQAYSALEQGLSLTVDPQYAAMRLRLLQTALGVPGNESTIKDISMRELTSYIVEPQGDAPLTDPMQIQSLETRRTIVSTTYKLYLNASKDPEATYADTERVLSYQRDPSTKELIIFDCLSHFPELRSRFLTN
jgi:LysM repeat protein